MKYLQSQYGQQRVVQSQLLQQNIDKPISDIAANIWLWYNRRAFTLFNRLEPENCVYNTYVSCHKFLMIFVAILLSMQIVEFFNGRLWCEGSTNLNAKSTCTNLFSWNINALRSNLKRYYWLTSLPGSVQSTAKD